MPVFDPSPASLLLGDATGATRRVRRSATHGWLVLMHAVYYASHYMNKVVGRRSVVVSKQAAREASERAMLKAAAQILRESPVGDIFSELKPAEVAKRADPPRTTGSFYNIWPTQRDFRSAFVDYLLSLDHFRIDRDIPKIVNDMVGSSEFELAETVRTAANKYFRGLSRDGSMRMQMALWAKAEDDPHIRARLKGLYDEVGDQMLPLYEDMLSRGNRRMRDPHTTQTLAVSLVGLAEGLHVRCQVDPAIPRDDFDPPPGIQREPGSPWSIFASIAYELIIQMTEPA
jgi:hypothetical protein